VTPPRLSCLEVRLHANCLDHDSLCRCCGTWAILWQMQRKFSWQEMQLCASLMLSEHSPTPWKPFAAAVIDSLGKMS